MSEWKQPLETIEQTLDTMAKLGNPTARTRYQNVKVFFQLKLTNEVQDCDNLISQVGQSTRSDTLPRAPKIGDNLTPPQEKAIVSSLAKCDRPSDVGHWLVGRQTPCSRAAEW